MRPLAKLTQVVQPADAELISVYACHWVLRFNAHEHRIPHPSSHGKKVTVLDDA